MTSKPFEYTDRQLEVQKFLGGPQRHKLIYGGARSGKTFLLTRALITRAIKSPGSRHAILRFRGNAARSSIALDTLPKVMSLCFPNIKLTEHGRDGYFELPNGAQIWIGGLDDKERAEKILGSEFVTLYFNECSQIPYSSVLIARTRLAQVVNAVVDGEEFILPQRAYYDLNPVGMGHWSHILFGEKREPSGKPPRPVPDPDNYARTYINPEDNRANLSAETIAELDALPERQRKRFFEGLYVAEVEGALWTYERIEACRIDAADMPRLARIVIAVDPSGAKGEEDKRSDEIGIVAVGKGVDGRGYVLQDASCRLGPAGWAREAVNLYRHYGADCIVGEVNYGGAMVEATIRSEDPHVKYKAVTASRGKSVRAEPISALYEEKIDKMRHVGRFPDLEDQLCKFSTSGYSGERSPDRADALVWAVTELKIADNRMPVITGAMLAEFLSASERNV